MFWIMYCMLRDLPPRPLCHLHRGQLGRLERSIFTLNTSDWRSRDRRRDRGSEVSAAGDIRLLWLPRRCGQTSGPRLVVSVAFAPQYDVVLACKQLRVT